MKETYYNSKEECRDKALALIGLRFERYDVEKNEVNRKSCFDAINLYEMAGLIDRNEFHMYFEKIKREA